MSLVSHKDFESADGQRRIVQLLHKLERKIETLEHKVDQLEQAEEQTERSLQGPEAY